MAAAQLQRESTEVLRRLVRFNTVNPPGNERDAIEYLASYLADAGLDTEVLAAEDERPNLVAELRGAGDGPTLCYLGHVDTVLAEPSDWTHDPWSGEVADGCLWGRGALDMKSQVAAEAVAAATLARGGWRPGSGHLKLVFVSDEETGGEVGAQWVTATHPERVRCDEVVPGGVPGLRRVRLLPASLHEPSRGRAAGPQRGRADRRARPRIRDRLLRRPGAAAAAVGAPRAKPLSASAASGRSSSSRSGRPPCRR